MQAHILYKAATSGFHPLPGKKYSLPTVGIKLPLPGLWKVKEVKKGETMKNAIIRTIAVAVFATSVSAFAISNDAKAAEDKNSGGTNVGTAVESNVSLALDELQGKVQQLEARDKESQADQKTRQDDTNKKIRQQDKEWDHSLLGNYGG
jgi:hypothetical protein